MDLYEYIVEIKNDDNPFTDHYGRCTYFKVLIADKQIPILQPGTVAFESAIKPGSNIATMVDGI